MNLLHDENTFPCPCLSGTICIPILWPYFYLCSLLCQVATFPISSTEAMAGGAQRATLHKGDEGGRAVAARGMGYGTGGRVWSVL